MKKIFFLLLAILPLAALAQNENRRVSIEPHAGMTISKMHGGALTRDETWKTGWTAGAELEIPLSTYYSLTTGVGYGLQRGKRTVLLRKVVDQCVLRICTTPDQSLLLCRQRTRRPPRCRNGHHDFGQGACQDDKHPYNGHRRRHVVLLSLGELPEKRVRGCQRKVPQHHLRHPRGTELRMAQHHAQRHLSLRDPAGHQSKNQQLRLWF